LIISTEQKKDDRSIFSTFFAAVVFCRPTLISDKDWKREREREDRRKKGRERERGRGERMKRRRKKGRERERERSVEEGGNDG